MKYNTATTEKSPEAASEWAPEPRAAPRDESRIPGSHENRIYRALGVRWFQKYVPTGGSYWTKHGGKSMLDGHSREALERFVEKTRRLETAHWAAAPLMTGIAMAYAVAADSLGDYMLATYAMASNLVANVYPILSQRYNRNIARRLLQKAPNQGRESRLR